MGRTNKRICGLIEMEADQVLQLKFIMQVHEISIYGISIYIHDMNWNGKQVFIDNDKSSMCVCF